MGIRVLVIGSGAREHALAYYISRAQQVDALVCAPGNGGTAGLASNRPVQVQSPEAIVELARAERADLVVIGPELPLVAGAVDALQAAGIRVFGPPQQAAALEGSKAFAKRFMERHGIRTAPFGVFGDVAAAHDYVAAQTHPLVVKADGLAAGKGVEVTSDAEQAHAAVDRMMRDKVFGAAGETVVVEQRLRGQEVSFHVVLDGDGYLALSAAQDHKAIGEGDTGANTGGMGAYSPPPVVTPEVYDRIVRGVVEPTVAGLAAEGLAYRGVLFIGLMIVDGVPHVLEYNVRFGDPETQVLLARYGGDVLELLLAAVDGRLSELQVPQGAPCAMCVVAAAGGYPGAYDTGQAISGLDAVADLPHVTVFHAGTRLAADTRSVVTSGGRVLGVTAEGDSVDEVAERAYAALGHIRFEGMYYRRDIGHHARTR